MLVENTIPIQEGNECVLRFLPVLVDGTQVLASTLENIVVKVGRANAMIEFPNTVVGDYILITLPADQPRGVYDLAISATIAGRPVRDARKAFFSRVPFDEGIPYKEYNTKFVIIGQSDDQIAELAAQLEQAIREAEEAKAAAEEAKTEFERKIAGLDDIAKESTSQEILNAINEHSVEITPISDDHIRNLFKDE